MVGEATNWLREKFLTEVNHYLKLIAKDPLNSPLGFQKDIVLQP